MGADARPHRPRVLVVDDGTSYAQVVDRHLPELKLARPDGAACAPDGPAALAWLARHRRSVDLVLLDVRFDVPEPRLLPLRPGASLRQTRRFQGIAILRELRRRFPELPVVLLSAAPELAGEESAPDVAATPLTYLLGDDDLDTLRIRVHQALEGPAPPAEDGVLWTRDASMQAARRRLAVLARGALPLILEGETGTGKSLVAERFVHPRSGRPGPFVSVDLATLPPELVPAQLFGVVRGAFTGAVDDRPGVFELAEGGTLLLDDVQNATPGVQRQLLAVLQNRRVRRIGAAREKPVDVKVVAATNEPLAAAVAQGRFRADLYMRLSPAGRVVLPPLRDRLAELPFLVERMAAEAVAGPELAPIWSQLLARTALPRTARLGLRLGRISPSGAADMELVVPAPAWLRLLRHGWPGNVRELCAVVQNLLAFTLAAALDAADAGVPIAGRRLQAEPRIVAELLAAAEGLPVRGARRSGSAEGVEATGDAVRVRLAPARSFAELASAVERQYFVALFEQTGGDFGAMAGRLLGDPRRGRAVRLRLNQLGLRVRRLRAGGSNYS